VNHWLQTKRYECPDCGATYLHDKAYRHACFDCPGHREGVKMCSLSTYGSLNTQSRIHQVSGEGLCTGY
jgi:hypothetical protein